VVGDISVDNEAGVYDDFVDLEDLLAQLSKML
jgi:hypothetical protein